MTSEVKLNITSHGAVIVNGASIYREAPDIVAIDIDLKSKYAELLCTSSGTYPGVTLCARPESLRLDPTKPRDSLTEVEFPEYPGWHVHSANGPGRYTVSLCLVRGNT